MEEDALGLARGALELRDYNPGWPEEFDAERSALQVLAPEILCVEHVGSTAIPGLAAKPIIDMQACLDWSELETVIARLLQRGYAYMPNRVYVDRVFMPKGPESARTHYLSLIRVGSGEWTPRLQFRDALRADSQLRTEYELLKRHLAEISHDRASYTAAKSSFVEHVLAAQS